MPKSTKSSSDYAKGIAQLSDYISTLPKYDYGRQAEAASDAAVIGKSKTAADKSKHGPTRRLSEGIGYGAGMVTSETLSGLEWALEYFNKSSERVDGWQNAVKDFTESTWGYPEGYAGQAGAMIGSLATFLIVPMIVGAGAAALPEATAVTAGTTGLAELGAFTLRAAPKLATIFNTTQAVVLDSLANTGQVYEESLAQHGNNSLAKDTAAKAFLANMALNSVTMKLGGLFDAAKRFGTNKAKTAYINTTLLKRAEKEYGQVNNMRTKLRSELADATDPQDILSINTRLATLADDTRDIASGYKKNLDELNNFVANSAAFKNSRKIGAARGLSSEGFQEATQEFISQWALGNGYDWKRIAEAGILGSIPGAAFGAAFGGRPRLREGQKELLDIADTGNTLTFNTTPETSTAPVPKSREELSIKTGDLDTDINNAIKLQELDNKAAQIKNETGLNMLRERLSNPEEAHAAVLDKIVDYRNVGDKSSAKLVDKASVVLSNYKSMGIEAVNANKVNQLLHDIDLWRREAVRTKEDTEYGNYLYSNLSNLLEEKQAANLSKLVPEVTPESLGLTPTASMPTPTTSTATSTAPTEATTTTTTTPETKAQVLPKQDTTAKPSPSMVSTGTSQIDQTTAPISPKITDVSPIIQGEAAVVPQEPGLPQVQQAGEGVTEQVPLMEGTAPTVELAKLSPEQQLSEEIASDAVKETPALVADAYTSETASNMGAAAVLESSYPSLWKRTPTKLKAALKKLPEIHPTISAYYLSHAYNNFDVPVDSDNYAEYLAGVKEAEKLRAEYNDSSSKAHTDNRKKLIKDLQAKAKANPKVADRVAFLQAVIDSLEGVVDFSLTFKANGLPRDIYGQFTLENNEIFARNPLVFAHEVGHWGFFTKLTADERIKFVEYMGQRLAEGKTLNDFLYENTEETLSNSASNPAEVFASRFAENLYFKSEKNTFFKSLFDKLEKFFKESFYNSMKNTRIEDPYLDSFFDAIVGKQTRLKDKVQGKMPMEKPLLSVPEKEVKKAEAKLAEPEPKPIVSTKPILSESQKVIKAAQDKVDISKSELQNIKNNQILDIPDKITVNNKQRYTINSIGNKIASALDEIKSFWKWFGDSITVTKEGKPLVLYHGTSSSFGIFDVSKAKQTYRGAGLYFVKDQEVAEIYGKYVVPVYVKMTNPLVASDVQEASTILANKGVYLSVEEITGADASELGERLITSGYDGLIIDNTYIVQNASNIRFIENEEDISTSRYTQEYNKKNGIVKLAERELEETNNRINNSKPKVAKITKMGNTNKLYKEFKTRGTGIVEVGGKRYYFDGKVSEGKCVVIPEELITAQSSAEDLMTQGKFELVSSDDIKQYWSNDEVMAQLYKEAKLDSKAVLEKVGYTLSSSNPEAVDLTSLGQFKNAFNSKKMIKPIYDLVPASTWDKFYLKNSSYIKDYAKSIGTSITPLNKNDIIQWAITANWNKFKSTPEGKRLQKDVMFALGMKERSQFYDYFKPLYDQEKMVLETSEALRNESQFYSRKVVNKYENVGKNGKLAQKMLGLLPDKPFSEQVKDSFDYWKKNFVTAVLDRLNPIRQADTEAYRAATLSASTSNNFTAFMSYGLPVYDKNLNWVNVGKRNGGFMKILNDMGEDAEQFMLWELQRSVNELIGIRSRQWAVEILAEDKKYTTDQINKKIANKVSGLKKGIFGNDDSGNPVSYDDMMKGITELVGDKAKLNEKKWLELEGRLREYNKAFLDMATDAGVIDAAVRATWERQIYIPLAREVQDMMAGKKMKPSGKLGVIKKLTGSEERLAFNPAKALIGNYLYLTDQTMKNIARKKAVPALMYSGALTGPLTVEQAKSTANTIEVKVQGKSLFFKVEDQAVFEALTTANNDWLNNAFMQFFRDAKSMITKGVSFTIAYRVGSFIKDTGSASLFEKEFIPVISSLKGFKAIWNKDPRYAELIAIGGSFGEGFYDVESRAGLRRIAEAASGRKFLDSKLTKKDLILPWRGAVKLGSKGLSAWSDLGIMIENSTRLGLYIAQTEAGKGKLEAAFNARDLLDFSRRGSNQWIGLFTAMIPFLNSRFQGLYKTVKPETIKSDNFLRRGALFLGLSLLLFAENKDKEDYKDLPGWDRFSNIHFFAGDAHIRLPLPFELGVIFNVLPTAFAQSIKDESYNAFFSALAFSMKQTFYVDPLSIQLFKPLIEVSLNTNRFNGGAIESDALQKLPPEMRYDNTTSAFPIYAARFASAVGLNNLPGEPFSPKKMEHLIEGYTAGFGAFALGLFDIANAGLNTPLKTLFGQDLILERPVKGYIRPQDYPGMSRFVMTGEMKYTKQQEEFYKYYREIEQVHSAVMYYRRKDPNNPEYEKYREKWGPIAAKYRVASGVKKRLGDISTEIQLTARNASLSAEGRDAKTQALLKQKNDLIKRTVEQLDIDM